MALGLQYSVKLDKRLDLDAVHPAIVAAMDEIVTRVAVRYRASLPTKFEVRGLVDDRGPGKPVVGRVGSPAFQAIFLETGAGPHRIVPTGRKLLRFKIDNRWISTREVAHPGMAARPALGPAIDETPMEAIFAAHLEQALMTEAK